jgi:hypothetical protein
VVHDLSYLAEGDAHGTSTSGSRGHSHRSSRRGRTTMVMEKDICMLHLTHRALFEHFSFLYIPHKIQVHLTLLSKHHWRALLASLSYFFVPISILSRSSTSLLYIDFLYLRDCLPTSPFVPWKFFFDAPVHMVAQKVLDLVLATKSLHRSLTILILNYLLHPT